MLENSIFYLSRAYVPFALFRLYRRGIFEEVFSFVEVKHMFRIAIVMHLIDLVGHAAFKFYTQPVLDRHIGINEDALLSKRK